MNARHAAWRSFGCYLQIGDSRRNSPTSSAPRAIALFLLLLLSATDVLAWAVYNESSRPVRVRVPNGDWDTVIQPGEDAACHWTDTGCNPSGNRFASVSLHVETLPGDTRDFKVVVSMEAGGYGVIGEQLRPGPWAVPGSLFVAGYRVDGSLVQKLPYGVNAESRNIRFLVTADCQYCNTADCPDRGDENLMAHATHQHMIARMNLDPSLRGICIAGDLTQFASDSELDTYLASIAGYTHFVYDGLGNHDLAYNRTRVRTEVRERKRTTVKSFKGDPHYSWDWHDVHFVQLNLMPADDTAPTNPDLNPMGALTYLVADLALHVGASRRPVILMHHYGFENFSTGSGDDAQAWWTAAQRLAYWNAIAPYNVVAIFTGHKHPLPTHVDEAERYVTWRRPLGASAGPDSIPTFVSGASLNGAYLEVEFNNANQLSVIVNGLADGVTGTQCYASATPIWVNHAAATTGHGWNDEAFRTVGQAVNATVSRLSCLTNTVTVLVKPGQYSEAVRITQPTRLQVDGGGTARIGP